MFPCKWEGCKHWRARADELSRVMRKKLYGLLSVCYPDIHAENAGWYWWYLISRFDTIGMTGVIPSPGTLMQLGGQWLQVQVTFSWDVLMFLCERTPQAGVLWDQFVDEGTSGKSIYAINLWSMMMERKRERERNNSWWLYKSMPRAFCTAEVWCLLELVQDHGCASLYVFSLVTYGSQVTPQLDLYDDMSL